MRRQLAAILADRRIRFLIVGAINTFIGYAAYALFTLWLFREIRFGYLLALISSYAVAITIAFVLYRRLVFVVRGHVLRDFARFVTVYLAAIAVNVAALPVLVEGCNVHPLVGQALILLITTLMSFFGHSRFSFRRSSDEL